MNRRVITYVLLCTSLIVIVFAQISFRRPSMWRWMQPEPAAIATDPVSTSTAQVPVTDPKTRRAPFPHLKTLEGVADEERFLIPAADALPEMQASAKAQLDAQARYHLLTLAKDAIPHSLESDGRTDIRYQALIQKSGEYRGEVVRIQGDLISLGEPMEVHGKLPGIEIAYLGLMTDDQPNHQYLVLFTDLPPGIPKDQSQWSRLYLRNVQFSGYFYKVTKYTNTIGKSWMLPVLVGKSPILPVVVGETTDWFNLFTIFLVMAIPVGLIVLIVPRYFRKSDARYDSLMQRFKTRRDEQVTKALEEMPLRDDPDLRLDRDQG
ncbi:MAG TPA: hypothetical protein PLN21_20525 [Gemmatales bacterium]|nr:hypothetical protein [Gemmatales bacterium]